MWLSSGRNLDVLGWIKKCSDLFPTHTNTHRERKRDRKRLIRIRDEIDMKYPINNNVYPTFDYVLKYRKTTKQRYQS